jgi:hypothetical protein
MKKKKIIVISVAATLIVIILAGVTYYFMKQQSKSAFIGFLKNSGASVSVRSNPMESVKGWEKYEEYDITFPNISADLLSGKDKRKIIIDKNVDIHSADLYKNILVQTIKEEYSDISYYNVKSYGKNIFILQDKRNNIANNTNIYKDYIVFFQPEGQYMHVVVLQSSPVFTDTAVNLLKNIFDSIKID